MIYKIGELCDVYDGPHATPKETENGPVYLGIKAITEQGRIDSSQFKYLSNEDYIKWTKRVTPQSNDIVFSYEATLGRYAIIPDGFHGCLGRRLAIVRVRDNKKLNYKYLYYYFLSPIWKAFISNNTVSGSTVDRISIDEFPNYEIEVPEIKIQNMIVSILDAVDTKIDINIKTINTLESMAKTLYDYWFVQFDFPDANGRPYKNSGGKMVWNEELGREIPAGWETGQVSDLGDVVAGGTPSTEHPEYFILDGIAWITPKDMSLLDGKYIFHGATDISEEGLKNSSAKLMPAGSVVYTTRAPIGYVAVAGNDVCTNQGFKSVVPKEHIGTEFVYYTLKSLEEHFKNVGNGSTFSEVSKETFSTVPICIPPQEIIRGFRTLVNKWSHMQKKTQLENRKLIALRDFLLPMLMNGQVTFCS